MSCENTAIRAHSVQKSTALPFIEEAKHVYRLNVNYAGKKPVCEFQKLGRNNASTFTGLCNKHDTEIFRPIDTKPLDLEDNEQLFLIAYRSITRELHAVLEGAAKLQVTHNNNENFGLADPKVKRMSAMASTGAYFKAWLTWRYRLEHFDKKLVKEKYREICHSIFTISGRQAVLASSSFFPIEDNPKDIRKPRITLNMIPFSQNETAVIFSYPKSHSSMARKYISPIMLGSGENKLLALSTLILDTTENFFLRPSHVDSWSAEKKTFIQEAYFSTVKQGAYLKVQPEFMLF